MLFQSSLLHMVEFFWYHMMMVDFNFVVESGVVIGYQVDNFTHTWGLVEHLVAQGCDDYTFLDQAVEGFKQCLGSIIMDSSEIPELDISVHESDTFAFSVSSGFLQSVSTISSSKLKLLLAY